MNFKLAFMHGLLYIIILCMCTEILSPPWSIYSLSPNVAYLQNKTFSFMMSLVAVSLPCGGTHQPPHVPPFLLMQNLSPNKAWLCLCSAVERPWLAVGGPFSPPLHEWA